MALLAAHTSVAFTTATVTAFANATAVAVLAAVGAAGGMVRPIFDGDGGVGNGSFVEPVDAFYE